VNLSEKLSEDMKQAMKMKDKVRLSVIRLVRSAVKNKEIESGVSLDDEEILNVFQKELKQRRDSLQAFESAGRSDLIQEVQAEIAVLVTYLPAQLSETDVRKLAEEVIAAVGASSKADMGKVMSGLMHKVRGRADGNLVQQVVQSLLQ
jgi:uncharacterized protein YqeY